MKLLNKESFIKFLKKELPQLSLEYANQNVVLNSKNFACNDLEKGGLILFLHFGNFFIRGRSSCKAESCLHGNCIYQKLYKHARR